MPVSENIEVKKVYICDFCHKKAEQKTLGGWYQFYIKAKPQVLLLEGIKADSYFEAYNLPSTLIETYCSLDCAKKKIAKDVDLFLASLKISKRSTGFKPIV